MLAQLQRHPFRLLAVVKGLGQGMRMEAIRHPASRLSGASSGAVAHEPLKARP